MVYSGTVADVYILCLLFARCGFVNSRFGNVCFVDTTRMIMARKFPKKCNIITRYLSKKKEELLNMKRILIRVKQLKLMEPFEKMLVLVLLLLMIRGFVPLVQIIYTVVCNMISIHG